jgi:hypothetical protein
LLPRFRKNTINNYGGDQALTIVAIIELRDGSGGGIPANTASRLRRPKTLQATHLSLRACLAKVRVRRSCRLTLMWKTYL